MSTPVRLDLSKLDANIARYTALARAAGVSLRAHVKGHRLPQITARQLAAGAVGISAHSAAEAAAHHSGDVVIAWAWRDPWRWERFAELARTCRVSVHVDDPAAVAGLSAAATQHGVTLGARIEVDLGLHRTGVLPENAVALAQAVDTAPGLHLDGVTGYAAIVSAEQAQAREAWGRQQAALLVSVGDDIVSAGLPCQVVSVGGTPTLTGALSVAGVTEVCAGAYALLDAGLAMLGECALDDVAISLRSTVDGLLDGGDQVWQPGVVMARLGEDTILPAHVCPLVAKPLEAQGWHTLVLPDRP